MRSTDLTKKTKYLLVTCCKEPSRREILDRVIEQLLTRKCVHGLLMNLTVIDNGSTDDTVEMLKGALNVPVYRCSENLGYWSAIKWYFDNIDTGDAEFIHIIESDHFYYGDMRRLGEAENFLLTHDDVGAVRLQEYSVKDQHLYNKGLGRGDGRKYAWVTHKNGVTGEAVTLTESAHEGIYVTNFLSQLHAMNRLDALKETFNALGVGKKFSEFDWQRLYHGHYQKVAILDGGIFHAKLGFTPHNPRALSGSWSKDVSSVGYRTTRQDTILQYPEGTVVDAWQTED